MSTTTRLKNYHILQIKFVPETDTNPAKIKIVSERFKSWVTISFGEHDNTMDAAQEYLELKGFNLIGRGEGKDYFYIITDTFESIRN